MRSADHRNSDVSDACDYGHGPVLACRLRIDAYSNVWLCRTHWESEMRWRVLRNLDLTPEARFDILPWPFEEVTW